MIRADDLHELVDERIPAHNNGYSITFRAYTPEPES